MNFTDDYNNTLTTNITDNYNDSLSPNCAIDEKDIDIIIPTLSLTIQCSLEFLCLISLMVYRIIKRLLNNKSWRNFDIHLILLGV